MDQSDHKPFYVADSRSTERAQRHFLPFVDYFKDCKNALEIASGQGIFLDQVKAAGGVMAGVEIDPELCDQLRKRGLTVYQEDFFEFLEKSKPEQFDGCMAAHIVEHFPPREVTRLLSLLNRAMQPGSLLVVITPNIANLRKAAGDFWRDPTHVRPYPVPALERLFRMAGWKLIKSGEHSDREPSISTRIRYTLRNALFGKYWVGEAIFAIGENQ